MQVQRAAALDFQCKDKFLVQSTVVPSETTEVDITPDMVRNVHEHLYKFSWSSLLIHDVCSLPKALEDTLKRER